ncbi:MAG: hypothetical protein H6625_00100 [Bdellovibrionaceae bacterium]|nr:hypothetical protein [Pseudobdellovibrionaceae bacterium]
MTSLKRKWVRKEIYSLSEGKNADVIEREEVDLNMDIGGRLGYETINLTQTSELANISYKSKNIVFGLSGYVPLFLNTEILFKGEASFPIEQTFTDNIKRRNLAIADVYQLSFDQALVFTTSVGMESPWTFQYGLGITYKGFMSKDLNFAYDTLFGANILVTANYRRFVTSIKISSLGNKLNLDPKSRDLEAILGLIIVDNEYYRDFILYTKVNSLTLNVSKENSFLELNKIQLGLSLGF